MAKNYLNIKKQREMYKENICRICGLSHDNKMFKKPFATAIII